MQIFQEILQFVVVHFVLQTGNQSFGFFRIFGTQVAQLSDFEFMQILATEQPRKNVFRQRPNLETHHLLSNRSDRLFVLEFRHALSEIERLHENVRHLGQFFLLLGLLFSMFQQQINFGRQQRLGIFEFWKKQLEKCVNQKITKFWHERFNFHYFSQKSVVF